jgi:hypothetical protein
MNVPTVTILPTGTICKEHPETGKLHCEDGPAVICCDGSFTYLIHGQEYRTDGPYSYIAKYKEFRYRPYPTKYDITAYEFADWYFITHLEEYEWKEETEKGIWPEKD